MKNYYGVVRSDDYLMHYGVKGMKWGVRKAIAKNNYKKLSKHYYRAAKKLANLNDKANISRQHSLVTINDAIASKAFKVGIAGTATALGAKSAENMIRNKYKAKSQLLEAADLDRLASKYSNYEKLAAGAKPRAAAIGAAGLGVAAGAKIAAHRARKRTTKEGHAKALAKRDAFQNEMKNVFHNTEYAELPAVKKKRHNRKRG